MPKRPNKRRSEEEETEFNEPKVKIRFHIALLALLGSFAVLTIVSLALVLFLGFVLSAFFLGIVLLMLLVPLISGFIAGRHIIKRDTWLLGIMGGMIWSAIEIGILFLALFSVQTVMMVKLGGTLEILILATLVVANCLFCLLGLRISAKPNALLQVKTIGDKNGT